jgi:hypothetical protein
MKEETTIANYYKCDCDIQISSPNSRFIIVCDPYDGLSESEVRRYELIHKLKKNTITKNRFIVSTLATLVIVFIVAFGGFFVFLLNNSIFSILIGFICGFLIVSLYAKLTDKFVCKYWYEPMLKVKHRNKIY